MNRQSMLTLRLAGIIIAMCVCTVLRAQDNYRSATSGNWNASIWQKDNAGNGIFSSTSLSPDSSSLSVMIMNGHTVTVTTAVVADSVTVATGGNLNIAASQSLTITNGPGTDLQVNGTLTNSGTLVIATSPSAGVVRVAGSMGNSGTVTNASASRLFFDAGSVYSHLTTTTAGTVPAATWSTTSTCQITGLTTASAAPAGLSQTFGNFTWNTANLNLGGNYIDLNGTLGTVAGNLTLASTGSNNDYMYLKMNAGTAYNLTVGGNLTVNSNGLWALNDVGTVNISCKDFQLSGTGTFFEISTSTGTATISISGNYTHTAATLQNTAGGSSSFVFTGNTVYNSTLAPTTGNMNYTVANGAVLDLGASGILAGGGALTVQSGGTIKVGSTHSLGAIQTGQVNGNIRVGGARTYAAGSTVIYNGSGAQTLGNGFPANANLTIENPAGLSITTNTSLGGKVHLANGNINVNSYMLTIGTSASSPGSIVSGNGKVVLTTGSLTRWFAGTPFSLASDTGLFPIQVGGNNRSVRIGGTPTAGGTVTVNHAATAGTTNMSTPFTDGGISVNVRNNAAWTVATGNGFAGLSYDMQLEGAGIPAITSVSDLRVTGATAAAPGTSVNGSGTASVPYASRTALSASALNNTFYIGSNNSINPLPVTFMQFSGEEKDGNVALTWTTASETNNDHFEVERSADGLSFLSIGAVRAAGNSSVPSSYEFSDRFAAGKGSYYRIKQVDVDGSFSWSNVIRVGAANRMNVILYPNPAAGSLKVSAEGWSTSEPVNIRVYDMNGQELFNHQYEAMKGADFSVPVHGLGQGTYHVRMIQGERTGTANFIKQ